MSPIRCELICESSAESLNQIYGGFGLLERAGVLELSFSRAAHFKPGLVAKPLLTVLVDGARLVYDLRDGGEIDEERLAACDLYFKRSFSSTAAARQEFGGRMRPLGLNYPVYAPGDAALTRLFWSAAEGWRSRSGRSNILVQAVRTTTILSRLTGANGGRWNAEASRLHMAPTRTNSGTVLFLTRLWDPGRNDRDSAARLAMNEQRVGFVRALREHFGPAFIGGVMREKFSVKTYPLYVADDSITAKGAYISLLRSADVCVTSTGFQDSIGWKMAEYVAHSKAIACEPLRFEVTGGFAAGTHYLEGATPAASVAAAAALLEDPERRWRMQDANFRYYLEHLRPDMLVLKSLVEVFAGLNSRSAGPTV